MTKFTFCKTGGILLLFLGMVSCQAKIDSAAPHKDKKTISPDFILEALKDRQKGLEDIRSFIQTDIVSKKFKQSLRQVLLVRGEDSIRIDTLGVFGQPMAVFIHKEDETLLYDTSADRLYTGETVWKIMRKIMGTVIDFGEFINVFSGNIPHLDQLTIVSARLNVEKTRYIVDTLNRVRGEKFLIELDAYTLLPEKMVKLSQPQGSYTVRWQNYQMVGDRAFPHEISLTRKDKGEEVTIEFTEPEINKGVSVEAFELNLPGRTPPAKADAAS